MKNPTITQYIESISDSDGLFRTLDDISIVCDSYDYPIFRSGNYSVIFRVMCGGIPYGLKCYTRQADYAPEIYEFLKSVDSQYINSARLLVEELYVYDEHGCGRYHSVLLAEWIDGETLGLYVSRLCRDMNCEELRVLAEKFDRMALWLLEQDFAHGDLKHDNILVTSSGELKLIDFDGMYFPSFVGRSCTLIGSPAYQHPRRDNTYFSISIDDYPICVISLSLHALSEDPSLFAKYNDRENLILNALEVNSGRSELFDLLTDRWIKEGNLAMLSLSRLLGSSVPSLPELGAIISRMLGVSDEGELDDYEVIDSTDPECTVVQKHGLFGFANMISRRIILETVYDEVQPFSFGLAMVRIGSQLMFINAKAESVVDCSRYDRVDPFRDSLSLVSLDGKFGFINCRGDEIIAPQYPFATSFRGGLAIVRVGDYYGCIGTNGDIVVPVQYTLDECRELHQAHLINVTSKNSY